LPSYFLLKVKILILEDRSYSFSILPPTTGFLLMFVKEQQKAGLISKPNKIFKNIISLKNVVQIAKFKFPNLDLSISIPVILGSLILVT
jgi:ribosomal protein L11